MQRRTTAHEVHDFQAISLLEQSCGPAIPRDDVTIQFHGHAIGLHAEFRHECRQRKRRGNVAEIALVAIDLKLHFTEIRVAPGADGASRLENFLTHSRCSGVSGTGRPRASLIRFIESSGTLPSLTERESV